MNKEKMKIKDILENRIVPFEYGDEKLQKLFSFFLHKAPTISSRLSISIDKDILEKRWETHLLESSMGKYEILAEDTPIIKSLARCGLEEENIVNRKSKGFTCNRKGKDERDVECLLRHIRNAIAHGNVFLSNAGNRKYIIFEDYNNNDRHTARILLSQADLQKLKQSII